MKRTKIVCTIGPASESKTKLETMIKSGLNVARLNFSHGTYKHHAMLIRNIRGVAKKLDEPVAILQDLQGPRIRIGDLPEEGIEVKRGQTIFLVPENHEAKLKKNAVAIPVQLPELYTFLKKRNTILIEDAKIQLRVVGIKNKAIKCKVKIGDVIKSHKGMNFPGAMIDIPAITAKDKKDLAFGMKQQVDFVSLSFVKDAKDIVALRKLIRHHSKGSQTKIIAKIERPEAVKNFDKILEVADGIMVARGDLGLEMRPERLPKIQKDIIRKCIKAAKPVIVATQMLDSMIRQPVPTRAEVSDVANSVLDGTDGIMLSGETATGMYPLKAVKIMNRIAKRAEQDEIAEHEEIEDELKKKNGIVSAVGYAAQDLAEEAGAKLIISPTFDGASTRAIAKYRSEIPVISLAATEKVRNQMALSWGVEPFHIKSISSVTQLMTEVKKIASKKKNIKKGDRVVLAINQPFNYQADINSLTVEEL